MTIVKIQWVMQNANIYRNLLAQIKSHAKSSVITAQKYLSIVMLIQKIASFLIKINSEQDTQGKTRI